MTLLDVPGGRLEYLTVGAGQPVTVFAHGLGGSIPDTRPLGSGVRGTKVFCHFRDHGASAVTAPVSYAELAGELRAVADAVGATRALGVSLGAGALCRLLVQTPDRFERVVFFLPALLDRAPEDPARLLALAERAAAGDRCGLAELLLAEQPKAVRGLLEARRWARARAAALAGPAFARLCRGLAGQAAVPDRALLARVDVPALVIGQEGDDVHPVEVARALAAVLPRAELRVFGEGGALWAHRRELRDLVGGFLAE
ncbi:alpha/beta fold hydrolase [Carbonactinospora thermoautotrophica]|uniref:alpha/beta fold hydrolase n=1 Tax=Carbonactinospora thermoautotrophica TaxID=1469144 RepID=UPI000B019ED3|nr:alpha/beta hydrolase [Carbonactinospora thermoautotrophica]